MGFLGERGGLIWETILGRNVPGRDPRLENTHPDDDTYDGNSDDDQCMGNNPHLTVHCQSVAICMPGYVLDPVTCLCTAIESEGSFGNMCVGLRCEDGFRPVPIGGSACVCVAEVNSGPIGPPPPPPHRELREAGPANPDGTEAEREIGREPNEEPSSRENEPANPDGSEREREVGLEPDDEAGREESRLPFAPR